MTSRREVFPLLAGAAGLSAAAASPAAAAAASEPELRRVSYQSARTGKQRDYFVYLPRGFAQSKQWPVMLFLHGDGERGDAKGELDFVLIHGPLFEAWCQRRDLPFVIISPQLDKFGRGEIPYIKYRDAAKIPQSAAYGHQSAAECRRRARCPTHAGSDVGRQASRWTDWPARRLERDGKRSCSRWSIARSRTSKATRSASI